MSEARALLEAALRESYPTLLEAITNEWSAQYGATIAATPSGAELIRRADRPEARVAVEGSCPAARHHRMKSYRSGGMVGFSEEGDIEYEANTLESDRCTACGYDFLANLPTPRPPEPDRAAALVEALTNGHGIDYEGSCICSPAWINDWSDLAAHMAQTIADTLDEAP